MSLLHELIIERIRMGGLSGHWVLDVYSHLLDHGASSEDAIKAMDLFVDDIIVVANTKHEERADD
jgi:hypothetical protein